MQNSIEEKVRTLYGNEKAKEVIPKLLELIETESKLIKKEEREEWSEKDVILITYADSFKEKNTLPLQTLKKFLDVHLKDVINGVHILPFAPYSSDRGFSVIDFYQVKKEFGSWEDVQNIAKDYRLMVDLVLNHISAKSTWFQEFLNGNPEYKDYFISFSKEEIAVEEINKIIRPRATPVLTPFQTNWGERFVWTTFSVEKMTDQVDLNYQNPEVFLEIIKVLLNFVKKGVKIIRLDAVPFIWKEIGTDCFSCPQVHTIIQLFREILNTICPSVRIITQVSASQEINASYFGNGQNEAQLIYNFALPPLTLQAFYSGDSGHLTSWAKTLQTPSKFTVFYNFLGVHDGIGVSGAKGILSENELKKMFDKIIEHGGLLSKKFLPSGEKAVYEINSTWWSALNEKDETFELALQKFLTSLAICFSLAGVPALYYHLLFGLENDLEGYRKSGIKRDVNRKNITFFDLKNKLQDQENREYKVFNAVKELIKKRMNSSVFNPNSKQEILDLDKRVFAVLRSNERTGEKMLCLHNVSNDKIDVTYKNKTYSIEPYGFIWEKVS